jgi:hypothetical protein
VSEGTSPARKHEESALAVHRRSSSSSQHRSHQDDRGNDRETQQRTLSISVPVPICSEAASGVTEALGQPTQSTGLSFASDDSAEKDGLSKADVNCLFSGAPHFTIQKSSRGKALPEAFFPWDKNVELGDLCGCRALQHESFALGTLHAHLPIPGTPSSPDTQRLSEKREKWKRPGFDLGIYEVPNRLGLEGKEPGTVGFGYFLELPVGDILRMEKDSKESKSPSYEQIAHMSSTEALKTLQLGEGAATVGKHAPRQDRLQLIRDGSRSWKRLGVRDIEMETIVKRLARISDGHDELVSKGFKVTIFDRQSCEELYDELFRTILFPPKEISHVEKCKSLEIQIEAIAKVLTTPGAWIDFSYVEWRLHLGQILWEVPPHDGEDMSGIKESPGAERKWLFVQLLLSIELVLRLDAALRVGMSDGPNDVPITSREINHFNKLRNTKLEWDLIVARRFIDHIRVDHWTPATLTVPASPGSHRKQSRMSHFKRKMGFQRDVVDDGVWNCRLTPRHPELQLEGLRLYAELIDWPNRTKVLDALQSKLDGKSSHDKLLIDPIPSPGEVIPSPHSWNSITPSNNVFNVLNGRYFVQLRPPTGDAPGGWLTRSWLTGLVLPGASTPHLLITSILENDPYAIDRLGTTAALLGGFLLDGRSWWSQSCVVGRVLAPHNGGTESMGCINTPNLSVVDHKGKPFEDGWVTVQVEQIPSARERTRIGDGIKVGEESSPLGAGQGKVLRKEFSMPPVDLFGSLEQVDVSVDVLALEEDQSKQHPRRDNKQPRENLAASVTFACKGSNASSVPPNVTFHLRYNVWFVVAQPCRLPDGHAKHLSCHPLHRTYTYTVKALPDLLSSTPPNHADISEPVWIVDACGNPDKDVFARAWCAQVGKNAIVARIGKVCVSCCIRMAKAVQIGIIIRVGYGQG